MTLSQSKRWSPESFWKSAYERLPTDSKDVEKVPYLDISLNYGNELVAAGKITDAVKIFRKVAAADYDAQVRSKTLISLGDALQRSGRANEAMEQYELAVRINPCFSAAHFKMGVTLEAAGNTSRSREAI